MWRRFVMLITAAVAAVGVSGSGTATALQALPDPAATTAVASLTDPSAGEVAIPTDFAEVMGYEPVLTTTSLGLLPGKPDGTCSSPVSDAWDRFTPECRVHDFGYDLLRYAARRDGELAPGARAAVDSQFARAVHADCTAAEVGCRALAAAAVAAVEANSWRQGDGVPVVDEDLSGLIGAGLLGLAALVVPLRRRDWEAVLARLPAPPARPHPPAGRLGPHPAIRPAPVPAAQPAAVT